MKTQVLIESIYNALPVSLQNMAVTAYGYHLRHLRYGKQFYKMLDFLLRSEWWSQEEISEYQNEKLVRLIRYCYENVPYYREVMDKRRLRPNDIRSTEDLPKLPILSKEIVRENPEKLLSREFSRKELVCNRTSGTTGKPLRIYLTKEALQFQWAIWWRHRARFGIRFGDRFLMFGARTPVPICQSSPPFWRYDYALNRAYLSTYHLSSSTLGQVVKWLNSEPFDFYTGYPSAIYVLSQYMEQTNTRLLMRPKYVVTGAEALLPAFERSFRRAFGVPVTEQYGSAEACGNFSKCEFGRFHLDFEFGIVELLPVENSNDPSLRRLVFTGLTNLAMPLIRYDIGDLAHVDVEPCPCGRQSLTLSSIDGRIEDYIRTPDGRLVVGMNQVFKWAPGIKEAQIIQSEVNSIEVRLVPAPNYSSDDLDTLESELVKRLGTGVKITFNMVEYIPRTASGKFRLVMSHLPPITDGDKALRRFTHQ